MNMMKNDQKTEKKMATNSIGKFVISFQSLFDFFCV